MLILSRNGISDLELSSENDKCNIPSRFFSCLALEHVSLSGCIINVPRFCNGFTLLQTLCLSYCDFSGFGIEKLVSSCPLLDRLHFIFFNLQGCLRILAPNLTSLDIHGDFDDICLETPKLASGQIFLTSNEGYLKFSVAKHWEESKFARALGRLSNIQKLDIRGVFTEYLAIEHIPENLRAFFNHLT